MNSNINTSGSGNERETDPLLSVTSVTNSKHEISTKETKKGVSTSAYKDKPPLVRNTSHGREEKSGVFFNSNAVNSPLQNELSSGTDTAEAEDLFDFQSPYSAIDIKSTSSQNDTLSQVSSTTTKSKTEGNLLLLYFVLMIIFGVGNSLFGKLECYPMYNYPFFLSSFVSFVYIPICFVYIWPCNYFFPNQIITKEQQKIPKHKFFVMGALDSIAGIIQILATNYIVKASLIVLLQQAAIPISMYMSRILLKARYVKSQYVGSFIVLLGIFVVLLPTLKGEENKQSDNTNAPNQILWILVMIFSCIPMTLSSVYKEKALGEQEIDVIYLNGWVSIFQFLISIPLAIPSAWCTNLQLSEIPANIIGGYRCYFYAEDTILESSDLKAKDDCGPAPFLVTAYIVCNIAYNLMMVLILKHGSSSLLYMASTILVPLGNMIFALPMVPQHTPMTTFDITGLAIIMLGLMVYRFWKHWRKLWFLRNSKDGELPESSYLLKTMNKIEREVGKRSLSYFGRNQIELLEPVLESRIYREQRINAAKIQKESHKRIRNSFLLRLGIAPVSPSVSKRGSTTIPQSYSSLGNGKSPSILQMMHPRQEYNVSGKNKEKSYSTFHHQ